jgi:hypothetical protein
VAAIPKDMSIAFDYLHHDLLLAKFEAYGVSARANELLRSYLSNRQQQMKLGSTTSMWKDIVKGVPQGSIVDLLFFNVSTNLAYTIMQTTIPWLTSTMNMIFQKKFRRKKAKFLLRDFPIIVQIRINPGNMFR